MTVKVHEKTALESIPMTPLIDVVFLLLVFFLVATTLSEEERQLSVQLPSASEAVPLTSRPGELVINITAAGEYFVSGEKITLGRLEQVLALASGSRSGPGAVLIRADKRCLWDHVVAVLNACNKAKIRNYRVTTLPASKS
jgi:biopolymer transport protein ExbD